MRFSGVDSVLIEKASYLGDAALALAELGDEEPQAAAELGLEVASLEARMLLGSGCVGRVCLHGARAAHQDVARLTRLETLVRMAEGRVSDRLAALETQEKGRPWQSLAGIVSLAGGVFSIAKQIL
jgi:hypothetical protein